MIFTSLSPNTQKDDLQLVWKILFQPWHWRSGEVIPELEAMFRRFFPANFAFSFESGRTALFAILKSLGIKKGDEVLVQAYTCVAAVAPILWCGARPIYVDCEKDFNLSPEDLAKKITPRCKAIVVQHTFGQPAQLEKIISLAIKYNLFLIEDGAHGLGSTYQGKKVGTFGIASFWSFGRDKVISATFGGIVTTNDAALAQKISALRDSFPYPSKIWILRQLLHSLILWLAKKTYTFLALGKIILELAKKLKLISLAVETREKRGEAPTFAFKRLPNALAILALNQFKKLDQFNRHRKEIAAFYAQALKNNSHFILPPTKENSESIYLRYTLLSAKAPEIIRGALQNGIELGNWYNTPVAPRGVDYNKIYYAPGSCPQAENFSRQSFNLPTHIQITEKNAQKIVDFIKQY